MQLTGVSTAINDTIRVNLSPHNAAYQQPAGNPAYGLPDYTFALGSPQELAAMSVRARPLQGVSMNPRALLSKEEEAAERGGGPHHNCWV
jgi:uncharacterized protein involved in high-affinity Fe2+ transport